MCDVTKPETRSSLKFSNSMIAIMTNWYVVITTSPMKFGRPMQNDMPMMKKGQKSKPEVEFQLDGLLFSENGSSNISGTYWHVLSKIGTQIVFDLLKCATVRRYQYSKPEVDMWRCVCYFGKSIWCHNSTTDHMPLEIIRSRSQPEIEFQYGGNLFCETGSNNISAVDWDISSTFCRQTDIDLLK